MVSVQEAVLLDNPHFFLSILQVNPYCSSSSNDCFMKQMAKDDTCLDACFGLYADVTYINSTEKIDLEDAKEFSDLGE